jgi:intracellular sulfur oxidation DsrE/DsrF family protein
MFEGRRLWQGTTGLLAILLLIGVAASEASHLKDNPRKHKIVYQLDDAGVDKARFVLRNMQNHIDGVGGFKNIEAVELVVFGPALKSFVTSTIDPGIKQALQALQAQGVDFGACGNTMKGFSITLEQLPEGSKPLPQGGVVRIMELQEAGYIYIRP